MMNKLSVILEKIEEDVQYHHSMMNEHEEYSGDWYFHLGWVDASIDLLWRLKELSNKSSQ